MTKGRFLRTGFASGFEIALQHGTRGTSAQLTCIAAGNLSGLNVRPRGEKPIGDGLSYQHLLEGPS
jgi:hypothetical protein